MLDMVSHNPRSAPVLGAAFRCGSQLESWSWSWRGTQCFGGLPNLIATLRFVSGSLSKRDWAFAEGEGGPGVSLARSFSLLLGESRRAFATIFACRISLLIGYMTCQLRLGQRRGNMDSRMQDMVLHGVPPFPISLALFPSPTPLLSHSAIFCTQFQIQPTAAATPSTPLSTAALPSTPTPPSPRQRLLERCCFSVAYSGPDFDSFVLFVKHRWLCSVRWLLR